MSQTPAQRADDKNIEKIRDMTIEELMAHAQAHGITSMDYGQIIREIKRRCEVNKTNPRTIEQALIKEFVRLSEMLDDYCMGGDRPAISLLDLRACANEAANCGRALLPKEKT